MKKEGKQRKEKIYKIKKLISGEKLGVGYAGRTLVACKKTGRYTHIEYNGQLMKLGNSISEISFQDKFGRGQYTLAYYDWQTGDRINSDNDLKQYALSF